ncbi:Z1 domain-containing protein [Gammaproteobacteria bacterium]|nr:Z1 domain-containing protein [Gammaproteobacteria bacterium]
MKINDDVKISDVNSDKEELYEGEHLDRIISTLEDEDDQARLREETKNIAHKVRFKKDVGLVFGQVQSGKTTSFEAVIGLLRDNDVPLTIVLAGVSLILCDQARERIEEAFLDEEKRDWYILDTLDNLPGNFKDNLKSNIDRWNNSRTKKGTIVVCMKDHTHIKKLTKELEKIKSSFSDRKVLIIDDEADQYSLNTRPGPENDPSTTYSEIQELRNCFENHTYLQYTATPQAPFLISTLDRLSPDWVERVSPGDDYIGFHHLFRKDNEDYPHCVKVDSTNDKSKDEIEDLEYGRRPDTLVEATNHFVVAAAQLTLEGRETGKMYKNLSMLVHPSRLIGTQEEWHGFVKLTIDDWKNILKDPEHNKEDYEDFKGGIKSAYEDYCRYSKERMKPFDEILEEVEQETLHEISIELINSGPKKTSKTINWNANRFVIVVSGQAMDRGVTVKGLITTYLSRGASQQSDTQIQRARFCGYKSSFSDLIRIYLEDDSLKRFEDHITTNADFISLISQSENKNFKEVRREWRISKGQNSCRKNVKDLDGEKVVSGRKVSKWSYPSRPHRSDYEANNSFVENFLSKMDIYLEKSPDSGEGDFTSHSEMLLTYKQVFEELLVDLSYKDPLDSENYALVQFWLDWIYLNYDNDKNTELDQMLCRVIVMNGLGQKTRRRAIRRVSKPYDDRLTSFGQGSNLPSYIGDANIFDPRFVTLQLHKFDLYSDAESFNEKDSPQLGSIEPLYKGVIVPAIRLPDELFKKYDLQTQDSKKIKFINPLPEEEGE